MHFGTPQLNRPLTGSENHEPKTLHNPLNEISIKVAKFMRIYDKSVLFPQIEGLFPVFLSFPSLICVDKHS